MIGPTASSIPPVFDRLQTLGDETRARLLLLLEPHEYTVTDLCSALQLPQSTVSRHLRVLSDDGWVVSRADGTSRHYRLSDLDEAAQELWGVVRARVADSPVARGDAERAREVRARRRDRSREFFSASALEWDRLRTDLFGSRSELLPLFGLFDPSWTVADLGAGTGAFAEQVHPFVERVIAVDSSAEMLAALESRTASYAAVEPRRGDLEALPIETGVVDVAFMSLVLHYIVEPAEALAEAYRVLKPGGRLVVIDMRAHDRDEYRATMGHVWTGFTPDRLMGWAETAGFENIAVRPLRPEAGAKGPLLFMATMCRPVAGGKARSIAP